MIPRAQILGLLGDKAYEAATLTGRAHGILFSLDLNLDLHFIAPRMIAARCPNLFEDLFLHDWLFFDLHARLTCDSL